jgi:hypothetical protein
MQKFGFAPLRDWQIDPPVARRARLLGTTPFEKIVDDLRREAKVSSIVCEFGKKGNKVGLHRYSVIIVAKSRTIDLWHNSRGGYRAQYYLGCAIGEDANAYALNVLGPTIEQLILQDSRRKRFWPLAYKSICHRHARLWIGQKLRLRHAKNTDRHLHVPSWNHHIEIDNTRVSKLIKWGALIPEFEKRLVLKGQWLKKDGSPTSEPPKAARARQINQYGYT